MTQTHEIMDVCLLAGKIMLENGAETYRVEDTMARLAASYGINDAQSYVTPTGIIFSVDGLTPTKLIRISERTNNLDKVATVNSISRKASEGCLSIKEASRELKGAEKLGHATPIPLQIAAAAIASGCFLIMFQGGWGDFIPAFISGGLGFAGMIYFHHFVKIKFFAELLASFIIGLTAFLMVSIGIGSELDKIIIGSVMPLVPGVVITNAVRDLMAGHLVSGLSKGAEALITAFAIGTGIAVVFAIY
nr:threonine/serine exporter family protein [Scopulibacillus darangshiensis]